MITWFLSLPWGWYVVSGIVAFLIAATIHCRLQTKHAVLRNYPLVGWMRYATEPWGEFLQQYIIENNWTERPICRIDRTYIYRAAKGLATIISFGSQALPQFKLINAFFAKSAPVSDNNLVIGPSCKHPYKPKSVFNGTGMSYGALSRAAVSAMSQGASLGGFWINTGEGGLSPYHEQPYEPPKPTFWQRIFVPELVDETKYEAPDLVFQIGTANYGARNLDGSLSFEKLAEIAKKPNVKMFEIKMSQGAKPGKGGILLAMKVTPEIAAIRGCEPYQDSISPNTREDAKTPQELLDLVKKIKEVTGKPVGIKFCMGSKEQVTPLFTAMAKFENRNAVPDFITLDGGDGGSAAAPDALAGHMGMTIHESLPVLKEMVEMAGLYDLRIIASGKAYTPERAAKALALGADYIATGRGFMIAMGCIQAMKCASGNCPTGVTSSKEWFIKGLDATNKSVRVKRYVDSMRRDIQMIANSCGVEHPQKLNRNHITATASRSADAN